MPDVVAGWYPDPEDPGRSRWWDGQHWTEEVQDSGSTTDCAAAARTASSTDPLDGASLLTATASSGRRTALIAAAVVIVVALAGSGTFLVLRGGASPPEEAPEAATEPEPQSVEASDEPSPEPEPAPEPEPEPEPADIRDTDWVTQEWTTLCGSPDSAVTLRLAPIAGEAEGGGDHGYLGPDDVFDAYSFGVDVAGVTYVDVTGDGREEAAFVAHCVPGNFVIQTVEVWHLDEDDELQQLPPAAFYDRTTGYVEDVSAAAGGLRLETAEPAAGTESPWIDGGYPVTVVTDYQWDAQDWVADEVSRDTPESAGCDGEQEDPELTARCFLEAMASGDRDAAARVASAEAIRDVAGADVDEILRDWHFDACEYVGGEELGIEGYRAEWACGWSEEVDDDGWLYAYGITLGINPYGSSFRVDWIEWWES